MMVWGLDPWVRAERRPPWRSKAYETVSTRYSDYIALAVLARLQRLQQADM